MNKFYQMILALVGLILSTHATATNEYGLADNCQDGVILHCWNWSYNTIKEQLPEIAKAGYTSVQTSPAQQPKDYKASYTGVSSQWWKLYQPLSFSIAATGQGWLGDASELKALCDEADKYGIKVIVDVVANHMAGSANYTNNHAPHPSAQFNTRATYYHTYSAINYSNRSSITNGDIDLPDLNTENEEVQAAVKSLIKELIDCGVDGFRFDAAKHIALPSEGSDFWTNILAYAKELNPNIYVYGEVLDGIKDGSGKATSPKEYCSLMSITDNRYGNSVSSNINKGYVYTYDGYNTRTYSDITADRLVLWAESHDTFMNDGVSANYTTSTIHRAWACLASRSQYTALYFARPSQTASGAISAKMGTMSTDEWKAPEVVAVNKFHNATKNDTDIVKKGNTRVLATLKNSGATIVYSKVSETDYAVEIENTNAIVQPGEYTDIISGNNFIVTESTISGNIGTTGIAVFYKGNEDAAIDNVMTDTATPSYDINGTSISLINNNHATINLYNMQGALVATSTTNTIEAPGNGIYILTIGNKSIKIII